MNTNSNGFYAIFFFMQKYKKFFLDLNKQIKPNKKFKKSLSKLFSFQLYKIFNVTLFFKLT